MFLIEKFARQTSEEDNFVDRKICPTNFRRRDIFLIEKFARQTSEEENFLIEKLANLRKKFFDRNTQKTQKMSF